MKSRVMTELVSCSVSSARRLIGSAVVCPLWFWTTNFITSGTTPTPGAPGKGAGALFCSRISVPGGIASKSMTMSARSAGPSVISSMTSAASRRPPSVPISVIGTSALPGRSSRSRLSVSVREPEPFSTRKRYLPCLTSW